MKNHPNLSNVLNQIKPIQQALKLLKDCDALLITAGAGMSVDSGLPDFRGNEGFWSEFPSLKIDSIKFPDVASPDWFSIDPYLVWAFYGYRYDLYSQVDPHDGFHQLLELAKKKKDGYFVYTSNIDGHFQRAGYPKDRVVECHGSIRHFQCLDPECDHVWSDEEVYFAVDVSCLELLNEPPHCPQCETMARPNVLMFDDALWNDERYKHQQGQFNRWLTCLSQKKSNLVVLEIGAGQVVATIRRIGEGVSQQFQARFIRVNPDQNDAASPDLSIQLNAEEALKQVIEGLL